MSILAKSITLTREASVTRKFLAVTGFSALLVVASLVKIPLFFTPVPVTLQTFVVLLAGACLGPVYGAMSVGLYLAYGLLGAPLFAGATGGLVYLAGPTGGYLMGFLPAAVLVGFARQRLSRPAFWMNYLVMLSGIAVIYTCGGLWLSCGYGWDLRQVVLLGIGPFIGVDLVKAFLAAVLSR
ncbi:MAG: biotin transporter BioY [Deltaproteobacteria bacterium]